jgi:hypothetical protein
MLTREDDIDVQGWTISLPRAWDHLEVLVSIADLALGFKVARRLWASRCR